MENIQLVSIKFQFIFQGSIPIDPSLTTCYEDGINFMDALKNSTAYNKFKEITDFLD